MTWLMEEIQVLRDALHKAERERDDLRDRLHLPECGYSTQPLGAPGCICVVVNRNDIKAVRRDSPSVDPDGLCASCLLDWHEAGETVPVMGRCQTCNQSPCRLDCPCELARDQWRAVERLRRDGKP
jgi:hypothetical protein